jgi:hypothetical protein
VRADTRDDEGGNHRDYQNRSSTLRYKRNESENTSRDRVSAERTGSKLATVVISVCGEFFHYPTEASNEERFEQTDSRVVPSAAEVPVPPPKRQVMRDPGSSPLGW